MNTLAKSGILGDLPPEELINEDKGSDMWKDAVSPIFVYYVWDSVATHIIT